jgi:hypothetical protein
MRSKPSLFVGIVCVISIIGALALSVTQLYSGAPPKLEYIGRSPDNSELLFNIRNSHSSAWSFYGAGPNAPAYEFQMPSGRRVQEMASPATTTVKKLARYPVPPHGKVSFAIPLPPGDTSSINVKVRLFPESFRWVRYQVEYYSNRCRIYFGKKAISGAAMQDSGVVNFWQQ